MASAIANNLRGFAKMADRNGDPTTAARYQQGAAEIERLQDVKRRTLAIADERAIEAVKARAENERLREALIEIANRASNMMDADAAEWMPSIYQIACEAVGEDPSRLLRSHQQSQHKESQNG